MKAIVEKLRGVFLALISLSLTLAVIAFVLFIVLYAVVWVSEGKTEHLVCRGTVSTNLNDNRTFYQDAQLGIIFSDTNWFGRTFFDAEPRYEYTLNALPLSAEGVVVRESDVNLNFIQLTDTVSTGDQIDDIRGRTVLYMDSVNGYVGLSQSNERDGYKVGFDFDGFCKRI